jgi:hypothetical protein
MCQVPNGPTLHTAWVANLPRCLPLWCREQSRSTMMHARFGLSPTEVGASSVQWSCGSPEMQDACVHAAANATRVLVSCAPAEHSPLSSVQVSPRAVSHA